MRVFGSRLTCRRMSVRVFSLILLVALSPSCLLAQPVTVETAELEHAEAGARAALAGFFEAFSRADNDALQEFMNYPHAFVGSEGSIRVAVVWTPSSKADRAGESSEPGDDGDSWQIRERSALPPRGGEAVIGISISHQYAAEAGAQLT